MNKLYNLDNTTILCGNWVDPNIGVKALKYSMKDIKFKRAIIFSHIEPTNLTPEIEFIQTEKFNHELSSQFGLHKLPDYIDTEFCLSIHDDGFIINPHLWKDEFFEYDYIGAPWVPGPWPRVGNGGFCLKSKKLLNLTKNIPWYPGDHDDTSICQGHQAHFISNGCLYAPVEVAMTFSLESKIPECEYNLNNCFGFHGKGIVWGVHFGEGQQFKDRIKLLDTID